MNRLPGMRTLLAITLLVCAACHDDHHSDPMQRSLAAFDGHLADLSLELDAHDGKVAAAADLAAIVSEEDRHQTVAAGHAGHMMEMADDMGQGCSHHTNSSSHPDMAPMHDLALRMRDATTQHRAKMGTQPDVAAARAEEARYRAELTGLVGMMRTRSTEMHGIAGDFHCEGGHTH